MTRCQCCGRELKESEILRIYVKYPEHVPWNLKELPPFPGPLVICPDDTYDSLCFRWSQEARDALAANYQHELLRLGIQALLRSMIEDPGADDISRAYAKKLMRRIS